MTISMPKAALLLSLLALAIPTAAVRADTIDVVLDQATILHLPNKVATIVIGNPSIADATLQTGGLLVVTGKGYGTTNLVALDSNGATLVEHVLHVGATKDEAKVTVFRGVERETWSCAPKCERSVVLGDSTTYFNAAAQQITSRNGQGSGAK